MQDFFFTFAAVLSLVVLVVLAFFMIGLPIIKAVYAFEDGKPARGIGLCITGLVLFAFWISLYVYCTHHL